MVITAQSAAMSKHGFSNMTVSLLTTKKSTTTTTTKEQNLYQCELTWVKWIITHMFQNYKISLTNENMFLIFCSFPLEWRIIYKKKQWPNKAITLNPGYVWTLSKQSPNLMSSYQVLSFINHTSACFTCLGNWENLLSFNYCEVKCFIFVLRPMLNMIL